jgi:drug/metabolite transporter (DMT)-like permease
MTLLKHEPFGISRREFGIVGLLGVLFAISSITLYSSFLYMEAGIACTILFVYPIMVAMIMSIFFKERVRLTTILSIALALSGIGLLYQGDGNTTLSTWGVILVLLSSLSYAIYIVVINRSQLKMSAVKLTLYVMIIGAATVALNSLFNSGCGSLQLLTTPTQLAFSLMLGIVPTLISLVTMAIAVRLIGSTPTAIMGSLEPVTAVAIGTLVFDERLTTRLLIGIAMILSAVIIIIINNTRKSKA